MSEIRDMNAAKILTQGSNGETAAVNRWPRRVAGSVFRQSLALVLLAALAAKTAPSEAAQNRGLAAAEPVAGQTESAPSHFTVIGKPTAPIAIKHAFAAPPVLAQPVTITLSVTPGLDLAGAVVSLAAEEPLALIEPLAEVALGDIAAGNTAELVVTVLPLTEATHYLGVTVTGTISGQTQWRSVAIPIRLPGEALRNAEAAATGNKDQTVRSFEAVETVR